MKSRTLLRMLRRRLHSRATLRAVSFGNAWTRLHRASAMPRAGRWGPSSPCWFSTESRRDSEPEKRSAQKPQEGKVSEETEDLFEGEQVFASTGFEDKKPAADGQGDQPPKPSTGGAGGGAMVARASSYRGQGALSTNVFAEKVADVYYTGWAIYGAAAACGLLYFLLDMLYQAVRSRLDGSEADRLLAQCLSTLEEHPDVAMLVGAGVKPVEYEVKKRSRRHVDTHKQVLLGAPTNSTDDKGRTHVTISFIIEGSYGKAMVYADGIVKSRLPGFLTGGSSSSSSSSSEEKENSEESSSLDSLLSDSSHSFEYHYLIVEKKGTQPVYVVDNRLSQQERQVQAATAKVELMPSSFSQAADEVEEQREVAARAQAAAYEEQLAAQKKARSATSWFGRLFGRGGGSGGGGEDASDEVSDVSQGFRVRESKFGHDDHSLHADEARGGDGEWQDHLAGISEVDEEGNRSAHMYDLSAEEEDEFDASESQTRGYNRM